MVANRRLWPLVWSLELPQISCIERTLKSRVLQLSNIKRERERDRDRETETETEFRAATNIRALALGV